ncbi:type II toxin-antitoxin system HicB family antitoxin [Gluconacetobacter sp. Hr-1-5]|uniref:type II toxin-antitoxin system HicB family antitoxin n=1 Tax=Gluconacetobacter sp. Hr-1-5 TaxID=3395370 RepID=UPI003B527B97
MTNYIALIHKDPDTDFGVSFPDFPGCITAGRTLDEAQSMAQEALEGHIACMAEDGEAVPAPSSLETIMADPENRDGVAVLIAVRTPSRAVRVNVTLEESLLSAISGVSKNRSKFLAEAAWEKLNREHAA